MFDLLGKQPAVTTYGKVTATAPLTVQFNGTAAADAVPGVKRLDTYTATIGDVVGLVKFGAIWVVVGEIV